MSVIEMASAAREYRELQAEIKQLEEQAEALKANMVREMDSRKVDELAAGEYKIRYTVYESNRLDTTKFKTECPSIYGQYCKSMTATRFQVA